MRAAATTGTTGTGDEVLVSGQRLALELITQGRPLKDVLGALCLSIERGIPRTQCSVLLVEEGRLRHAVAPNLPEAYTRAIDGEAIGPQVGSCGTAAYLGRTVVTEDVTRDPLWTGYAALATNHGLAACASVPIVGGSDNQVLGTFAIYHQQPGPFSPREIKVLTSMTDVAALAILHDRRDQELHESQHNLRQAQKVESLTVLAGGIAHHFNNLLTAMLGSTNLLQRRLSHDPIAMPLLQDLESLVERASALTRQMLAYAGKAPVAMTMVDVNGLLSQLLQLVSVAISRKIQVRTELGAALPPVRADATQLQQLALNLITNAAEAIGETSGKLVVRTSTEELRSAALASRFPGQRLTPGTFVKLEVCDSGPGITAEVRERMFEPFFTTKFAGRGLGLAATLGILKGHQGGFELYSEPGQGTRFAVFLPAASREATAPSSSSSSSSASASASAAAASSSSSAAAGASPRSRVPSPAASPSVGPRHRVLLVEDEESVRMTTCQMLRALGHEVWTAGDGREALNVIEERAAEITVVLMDLTMPGLNGAEATAIIQERWPALPVVLSSGYEEGETSERLGPATQGRFLKKPFNLAQLDAMLAGIRPR